MSADPWGDDRDERQAERDQAARETVARRQQLDVDILLTFSTDQGKRVLAWLEESCYAYRSIFSAVSASASMVDTAATFRAEGRRTVWTDVHNAMNRARAGQRSPAPEVRSAVSQEG
jgi:hypothetical protein